MAPAVPQWVLQKIRDMVRDGLSVTNCAAQLTSAGYPMEWWAVKQLKAAHRIQQQWTGSDRDLDAVIVQMVASGELGPDEGYRWVADEVSKKVAARVGRERVRHALKRQSPQWVAMRLQQVRRRLVRRVYSAPY